MKGVINVEMEGATWEETQRLQQIVHILIERGALSLKNGKVTLSFDNDANLGEIKFDAVVWRKDKASNPLHKSLKSDTITTTTQTPNMGGKAIKPSTHVLD